MCYQTIGFFFYFVGTYAQRCLTQVTITEDVSQTRFCSYLDGDATACFSISFLQLLFSSPKKPCFITIRIFKIGNRNQLPQTISLILQFRTVKTG